MKQKIRYLLLFFATVLIAGCGSGTDMSDEKEKPEEGIHPTKPIITEEAPSNWYIRLVAEDSAREMKTLGAQLGEIEESDAVEKHTLKAPTPFGSTYLDVVFHNPEGVDAGDYKVNFHNYSEETDRSWRFTVRTDDPHADILLSWRGVYVLTPYLDDQNRHRYREYRSVTNPLIGHMKLVDVKAGNEIAAAVNGKVQTYVFNMEGEQERTFEWVVQSNPVDISVQTIQARAVQQDVQVVRAATVNEKKETFDLHKPPMIKEDMHGN
ncbi:MAG: hypothetical protein L3J47_00835 [Sulfurovum sp.]|nr:hypothetical protein [Sulfurovum sp.]